VRLAVAAARPFRFPHDLDGKPLIVPSEDSPIRPAFDLLPEERFYAITLRRRFAHPVLRELLDSA
jgi:hypothetical protein